MKENRVEEINKIKLLKAQIVETIDDFLEENYTQDEIWEALMKRGEKIGYFKKSNPTN